MLSRLDISAYKRIYDKNPMAVAVVTLLKNMQGEVIDFEYNYTNQAMADIDGIKVTDIIGQKYSAIYKRYPSKTTIRNLAEVGFNGGTGTSQEYWNELSLSVSMHYSQVSEGVVLINVVGISNIEQLRSHNEQLVNKIPGGVVIIEVTDTIHFFSL